MKVDIPDELVEDIQILDRLASGRIKDIWPRMKGEAPIETKINMARYRISELISAVILKEFRRKKNI